MDDRVRKVSWWFSCHEQLLNSSYWSVDWLVSWLVTGLNKKKLPLPSNLLTYLLNLWKHSNWHKTQMVKYYNFDKTQIVTKSKLWQISKYDKLMLWQNSSWDKTKIVIKLKIQQNSGIDKHINVTKLKF